MGEVQPMEIDGEEQMKPKIDVVDRKTKQLKRKRVEPSSFATDPEDIQRKINDYRSEINSLVKFCKNLVSENRGTLLENVEKVGKSLNGVIACLIEESDLPLSKLVDDIIEKVKGRTDDSFDTVSKASVKSTVLLIGQRLCYGVPNADADLLEDEDECALWYWETRGLKLIPKVARISVEARRTCRKKIHERITAVLAMIKALEKSGNQQNYLQEVMKALEKLGKVLNEAEIQLIVQNMSLKNGAEMAEKEAKKDEKQLIKEMEKNKRETEKERKKMDRELQKEKLQSEKELKRLHDEAEKEERRREKEKHDIQKQQKRQQEEAEKDQKRKEKEEAELKKQVVLKKQALVMERFLKRHKTTTSQEDNSVNKETNFQLSSNPVERTSDSVTLAMDSILSQSCGIEADAIWKSHLSSWRCAGSSTHSNRHVHWGMRQKPKVQLIKEIKLTTNNELTKDEEKLVDGWVDSNVDGSLSQKDLDRPLPNGQKRIRHKQLLQFDKSHRPAFYGAWPKKSQVVISRNPFAKDPEIDYEIDSDEEWEEDEPGESLSDCDKDDEDESLEEQCKVDDEDESEDGFFVPDGYLSENEGVEVDEMETDEVVDGIKDLPDPQKQGQSEEFCTLLRQQKHLNELTEHALKKNKPLIILNFMHEKTTLLSAEELTVATKLERTCLQSLSIRPLPGFPSTEISINNNVADENLEGSSSKSGAMSSTKLSTTPAALPDSDLPQIITIIRSCQNIGKIVESLHDKFPAVSKTQLRNKVREIAEFSENRWQVKKEILSKLGLSISPERSSGKAKSIAAFFPKRCL